MYKKSFAVFFTKQTFSQYYCYSRTFLLQFLLTLLLPQSFDGLSITIQFMSDDPIREEFPPTPSTGK